MVSMIAEWTPITLLTVRPRVTSSSSTAGSRRARWHNSSTVAARRICSCSEMPAVAGETMKSRGAITPHTPPTRSTTSTKSASRSSSTTSASAAESPRTTVGG